MRLWLTVILDGWSLLMSVYTAVRLDLSGREKRKQKRSESGGWGLGAEKTFAADDEMEATQKHDVKTTKTSCCVGYPRVLCPRLNEHETARKDKLLVRSA